MIKENFFTIIENEGWVVADEGDQYLISKYSPAGEDFGFTIEKGTSEEMSERIIDYVNDFDADEHAKMWIDNRQTNGVPQSIRDLIDDADAIKEMLLELQDVVRQDLFERQL